MNPLHVDERLKSVIEVVKKISGFPLHLSGARYIYSNPFEGDLSEDPDHLGRWTELLKRSVWLRESLLV